MTESGPDEALAEAFEKHGFAKGLEVLAGESR